LSANEKESNIVASKCNTRIVVWGSVDRNLEIEKINFCNASELQLVWIRKNGVMEFVEAEEGCVQRWIEGVGIEDKIALDPKTEISRRWKVVGFFSECG
jgi:hypothetical protein